MQVLWYEEDFVGTWCESFVYALCFFLSCAIFWMKLQSGWCCGGETSERRGADFLFPFHRLRRCWHETVLMDGGLGW